MIKKIIKFTLLSVLILVVGFVLGVLLNGINFSRFKEEVLYTDWMKNISDETYLNDIVIPGSHDAGSYDMVWLGETQKYTIKDQKFSQYFHYQMLQPYFQKLQTRRDGKN